MGQDTAHSKIREQFYQIAKQSRNGTAAPVIDSSLEHERKQVRVQQLINAYRMRGHQWANVNPLETDQSERIQVREMELRENGLHQADLDVTFNTGNFHGPEQTTLRDIVSRLEKTYCGSIGIEYMHVLNTCRLYTSDAADE